VLQNVPEAQGLAARGQLGLATSDTYFIERLTGRYVTEPSTAGRTGLMNIRTSTWDENLCALFGVPIELLPEIVTGPDAIGEVKLPQGSAELSAGLIDQVAALYGHGCRAPGDAKFTFGTGAFGLAISGTEAPDLAGAIPTACWHGTDGRLFAADGGIYTAGAAIEWLRRIGMLSDVTELDQLAGDSAASRGVFFVPALSGLACPHWDRSATGMWIGLDSGTGRTDMQKAVLEGIAFRTAEVLDVLIPTGGSESALSIDGGLARSPYFTRFLASICARRIDVLDTVDLTAVGAAEIALARASGSPLERKGRTMLARHPVMPDAVPVDDWRARFTEARSRASGWRR
jgi:glycerol kinase